MTILLASLRMSTWRKESKRTACDLVRSTQRAVDEKKSMQTDIFTHLESFVRVRYCLVRFQGKKGRKEVDDVRRLKDDEGY